jgi:hypothetical protein
MLTPQILIVLLSILRSHAYPVPGLLSHSIYHHVRNIIQPYYFCAEPGVTGVGTMTTQNTVVYSQEEIEVTLRAAYGRTVDITSLLSPYNVILGSNGSGYPHRYLRVELGNVERTALLRYHNVNNLALFPILPNGRIFSNGDDPGPDRIVLDAWNGNFVGIITHRGERANGFHMARTSVSNPLAVAPPAPYLAWDVNVLWGVGGSGPMKRSAQYLWDRASTWIQTSGRVIL